MKLKPHHALCIILFSSKGHSQGYADAMRGKIAHLQANSHTEITLSTQLDDICGYCLHNNKGMCEKAEETDPSDDKILAWCGLEYGSKVQWSDLRERIVSEIIAKGRLRIACEGCMFVDRCECTVGNCNKKGLAL